MKLKLLGLRTYKSDSNIFSFLTYKTFKKETSDCTFFIHTSEDMDNMYKYKNSNGNVFKSQCIWT